MLKFGKKDLLNSFNVDLIVGSSSAFLINLLLELG